MTLGLIMIVRDEAPNLPRSLAPVARSFDEVVVVDSGSSDASKTLAAQLGARVYDYVWNDDFAAARNRAIELASSDWLMWLDGDNSVPPDAIAELRALLPPQPAIIWGLEQVSGSGELLWQKRVFPNRPEARFQGRVHEQLAHPKAWPSIVSRLLIEHWGYQNPEQMRQKGLYYLRLLNQSIADDPDDYYALFQAARCHFNLRQFAEARRHLDRAVANPQMWRDNPDLGVYVQIMLSTTLERLLLGNDSLKLLLELCQRRPDSALAFFAAGKLAYTQGNFPLAAAMLDKSVGLDLGIPVINLNPRQTRFSAHYLLGLALVKLNRLPAAAAQMQKALQIDPLHRGARLDMAETLWRMNNKEAARLNLEMVIHRHPHDIKAGHLVRKWKEHA